MTQTAATARSGQIVDLEERTKPRPPVAKPERRIELELGDSELTITEYPSGEFVLRLNDEQTTLAWDQIDALATQLAALKGE